MTDKERQTVIQSFYDSIPADISNDLLLKKIIAIPNKEERSIIAKYECDSEIDIVAFDMFGWKYPEGAQLSSIGFIIMVGEMRRPMLIASVEAAMAKLQSKDITEPN